MERRVLVWTKAFLSGSETFVRDQADALERWTPICAGIFRHDSVLRRDSDIALYGDDERERLLGTLALRAWPSPRVRTLLAREHPDLIHVHFAPAAWPVLGAARAAGIPVIVTVHGQDVTAALAGTPSPMRWVRRRRIRSVLRGAASVIAVSEFIAERAVAAGAPPERVSVRYIGTRAVAPPEPRPPAVRDVIFVGRLVEKKGVADLLEALGRALDHGVRVRAAIVGDGPMRAELERRARERGLELEFLGARPPAEVRELLASSRIFVGPSRTAADGDAEGFGLVFIEAAMMGLPAVAYAHGGVSEAVADGDTGLLADEGDVDALARCLVRLHLDDELRATMGEAARARALERFDLSDRTARLETLYDDVMASRPSTSSARRVDGAGGRS